VPAGPHLRSIYEIRMSLEEIRDAIRFDDPLTETTGAGSDPAIEVVISQPGSTPERLALGLDAVEQPSDESDDGPTGEPAVAFEVPPRTTDADVRSALGRDRLHEIDRVFQLRGSDAYGWYTTFHQKRVQYGVHIPFEGILAFVVHALAEVNVPLDRKLDLAFHAILRHELFHFNVDCMAANWELATGAALYWKGKDRYRQPLGYVQLEEALANAYMLRGFKNPNRLLSNSGGAYEALKRFCARQPAGYKDGARYVRTRGDYYESYFGQCFELSDMYQHESSSTWTSPETLDALIFYPDLIRIDWTRCPVIIVDEHNLRDALGITITYFEMVKSIEETADFVKSYRKLDRRLQKLWTIRKQDLARSTALKSLDFKQWKTEGSDVYSVRLDGNYRAHLRYDRGRTTWYAEGIGNHKAMGHG